MPWHSLNSTDPDHESSRFSRQDSTGSRRRAAPPALALAERAGTLKKLSLELGGNAPFIVFEDADLDAAVQGALASKYRNSGQTCVCANRLLVHAQVYEAFAGRLVEAVRRLRVGDGLQGPSEQGPLIDERAVAKVERHIADALAHGAPSPAGASGTPSGEGSSSRRC